MLPDSTDPRFYLGPFEQVLDLPQDDFFSWSEKICEGQRDTHEHSFAKRQLACTASDQKVGAERSRFPSTYASA